MADPLGFEPRQRDSKSLVLPLHQGSKKWWMMRESNPRPTRCKRAALPLS